MTTVDISDLQAAFGSPIERDFGFLPFRCYNANLIVGGQGIRRGQFVEVFGAEGTGKSTILYELLGIAAAQGNIVVLCDQEGCADGKRLAKFGLTPGKNLVYIREPYLEALFEKKSHVFSEIRKKHPGVPVIVGLDSLGITLPYAHYSKFVEEKKTKTNIDLTSNEQTAANAKAWAKMLRFFFAHFHDMNITTIVLNHKTQMINTGPFGGGPKSTTPGGQTQKHMMFTRIEMIKVGKIENAAGQQIGNEVLIKTHKCKDAPPFQEARVPLYFGNPMLEPQDDFAGTYDCGACFRHLKNLNAFKGSGWYTFELFKSDGSPPESFKFQGENGFRDIYNAHQQDVWYTMMRWHYAQTAWSLPS